MQPVRGGPAEGARTGVLVRPGVEHALGLLLDERGVAAGRRGGRRWGRRGWRSIRMRMSASAVVAAAVEAPVSVDDESPSAGSSSAGAATSTAPVDVASGVASVGSGWRRPPRTCPGPVPPRSRRRRRPRPRRSRAPPPRARPRGFVGVRVGRGVGFCGSQLTPGAVAVPLAALSADDAGEGEEQEGPKEGARGKGAHRPCVFK